MRPVLDWRPNPDPRNALFLMSIMDCYGGGREYKGINRTKKVHLDQGVEGACTGFGFEHVRALSPYQQQTSDARAREVYRLAQRYDEWPGEDYEGSSVNGAMKAGRALGLIREWRWCYSLPEVRHALSFHGAVEAGTWWWSGMWEPDDDGFLRVTGSKVGGHAYALAGYRTNPNGSRDYRMENSWGPSWGDKGGAWITEFDLLQLLSDDGEFAVPKKVRF